VYNKALGKLLYCHTSLINNIKSKFIAEYNGEGKKIYKGLRFVLPQEISYYPFIPDIDNYIGINELVLAETVNRTLKKIYDVQSALILKPHGILQSEIINIKPVIKLAIPATPVPTPTPTGNPLASATPTPSPTAPWIHHQDGSYGPVATPLPPTSTPTPSPTPTPTLSWPWAETYTATDTLYGLSAQDGVFPEATGALIAEGFDAGAMTYTNSTSGKEWDGYLYNNHPIFISDTLTPVVPGAAQTDLHNVLYFDGTKWVIDTQLEELNAFASPNLQSGITSQLPAKNTTSTYMQRVSGGDMTTSLNLGRLTPIGNYYYGKFNVERVGYIS
jgi:hypothetical protein